MFKRTKSIIIAKSSKPKKLQKRQKPIFGSSTAEFLYLVEKDLYKQWSKRAMMEINELVDKLAF